MEQQFDRKRLDDTRSAGDISGSIARMRMLEQIAWLLWDAERRASPIAPARQLVPDLTLADAYEIRKEGELLRMTDGAIPVGRRVSTVAGHGVAAGSERSHYWCYIFGRRRPPGANVLRLDQYIAPSVSAHLAVELATELGAQPALAELVAAIGGFVPVLEISDCRTLDSSDDDLIEVVADGGRHACAVLGARISTQAIDWGKDLSMRLNAGEQRGQRLWRAAVEDDLLHALAWLASAASGAGEPLRGGELVLVGGTAALPLEPGHEYWGEFAGLGADLQLVGLRTHAG